VTSQHTVLLYGGTGRTGGQLLDRGVAVRAIVRDVARLPAGVADAPHLTVVEADPLGLSLDELRGHLDGCDDVIACLGHTMSVRGILGPPYDLVTRVVRRTCEAIEGLPSTSPVRLILMSRPDTLEPGDVSEYRVSPETTASLFRPDHTRMANVAHFMCELATDRDTWTQWRYAMPVLADAV
jgi:hypothetical protein